MKLMYCGNKSNSYRQKLNCVTPVGRKEAGRTHTSQESSDLVNNFHLQKLNREALASLRGHDLFTQVAIQTQLHESERLIIEKLLQEIT